MSNSSNRIYKDFNDLDKFDKDLMLPLSMVLTILGFDFDIKNNTDHLAYIINNYLNHPKYRFTPDDYKITYDGSTYNRSIYFSINGFKKLSLIYTESPNYAKIIQYFCDK